MASDIMKEVLRQMPEPVPDDSEIAKEVRRQMEMTHAPGKSFLQYGYPGKGLDDLGLRAKMSFAETFEEKQKMFREKYPEGNLRIGNNMGREILEFRRAPKDRYDLVDPFGFEIGDIGDIVGALPEITGEAALMIGAPEAKLAKMAFRGFVGAMGGHAVEEAVETASRYQLQGWRDITADAFEEGTYSTLGVLASVGVSLPARAATGRGVIGVDPGGHGARIAADRLGLPEPMLHQVSRSPIIRKLAGQAGATLPTIDKYWLDQEQALASVARRLRIRSEADLSTELNKAYLRKKAKLENLFGKKTSAYEGGEAWKLGVAEYDETARATINQAYKEARVIESPTFDPAGRFTRRDGVEGESILEAISDLEAGRPAMGFDEQGKRIVINGAAPLPPPLRDVMEKLKQTDFTVADIRMGENVYSLTDYLRGLRQQLWDLKTPPPGEPMREISGHYQAARMYDAITRMLRNPTNENKTFTKAWKKADELAAERFDTFDKSVIREAGRTQTPTRAVRAYFEPYQLENLTILKNTLPNRRWETMRNFFKTHLFKKGRDLNEYLDTFDEETLRAILPEREEQIFREIGVQLRRLEDVDVQKVLEKYGHDGARIRALIERKDTAAIQTIVDMAGGKDTPLGRSLRAGLIDNIVADAIVYTPKEKLPMLNTPKLISILNQYREKGHPARKILKFEDWRALYDMRNYGAASAMGADSGTSIQAAEAIAGARGLQLSAFRTILENLGVGAVITNKRGRFLLAGKEGKRPWDFRNLRLFAAAMASTLASLEGGTVEQ